MHSMTVLSSGAVQSLNGMKKWAVQSCRGGGFGVAVGNSLSLPFLCLTGLGTSAPRPEFSGCTAKHGMLHIQQRHPRHFHTCIKRTFPETARTRSHHVSGREPPKPAFIGEAPGYLLLHFAAQGHYLILLSGYVGTMDSDWPTLCF